MEQVLYYFTHLFSTEGLPPRWLCGVWSPFQGWFYILSDLAIFAAYFTIPFLILYIMKKGIPEDQIGKLFENFYRVSRVGNKQVSEIEGTGLGLAYIKRLVALHQGEIFVESIVGEGSTFTCSIPKSIAAQGIIETEMSSAAG